MVATDTSISCSLCRRCATALATRRADGSFVAQLPALSRAAGFWQGPEPEEVRQLTYAERRVLRLARVDACVKRVAQRTVPWT
eukprot:15470260-Alexandrium_andersonii.AAC.1